MTKFPPLIAVYCSFSTHKRVVSPNFHKNCLELFLSAHILLWEILNLNLTTMLECRGRNGTRQKRLTSFLKMVISFCLSFPNAYLAFQYGGFLPREWLATKSLFNRFFLATHDWSPPPPSSTLHTKCMHNFASVSILHWVGEGELKGICKKMTLLYQGLKE